jgi:hypothetical protein
LPRRSGSRIGEGVANQEELTMTESNTPAGGQQIGGELLARMLSAEGVTTVFGIIDGTYLGLYTAFEKYGIRLVSPRHETCAAHMAGAYARSTGRLGVCMASNGPGVANILPGVAVESGEGNRVLLITSCRRTGIAYPERGGTFQYFDQVGVTAPMTKWSGAVHSPERLPELARQAIRASWVGRPGVVHLDVPENIMNGAFDFPADAVREPTAHWLPPKVPVAAVICSWCWAPGWGRRTGGAGDITGAAPIRRFPSAVSRWISTGRSSAATARQIWRSWGM